MYYLRNISPKWGDGTASDLTLQTQESDCLYLNTKLCCFRQVT